MASASLLFAFTAGAFTFFAPCAYPLLPGYVSYYLGRTTPAADGGVAARAPGQAAAGTRTARATRAVVVGVVVSVGFFLVYGLLAGVVVALGSRVLGGLAVLELLVGGVLVAVGSAMALGWTGPKPSVALPERRRSVGGYLGFGVLYAAAAAGCTAPVFVGVVLAGLAAGAVTGVLTMAAYAAGMSTLMVGVTLATALGRDAVLSGVTDRFDRISRVAGVLLALAGLVQVYLFVVRFRGLSLLGF